MGGLGGEGCGEMNSLIPMESLFNAFGCLNGCCDLSANDLYFACILDSLVTSTIGLTIFICYAAMLPTKVANQA